MTASKLLFATALTGVLAVPAMAQDGGARNVILMVSDGAGFNGWLAADYYQGLAGEQSYQVARPDGTEPFIYGMAHDSLNLIDETGAVLENASDPGLAAGAVAQGYDPQTRWLRFENAFRDDFPPAGEAYTSYTDSAAAGTTLHTGRKTANGRISTGPASGRCAPSLRSPSIRAARRAPSPR